MAAPSICTAATRSAPGDTQAATCNYVAQSLAITSEPRFQAAPSARPENRF